MALTELYEDKIKRRSIKERLQIAHWILHDLTTAEETGVVAAAHPRRSLLELEGLGVEIWEGVEAQEYVDELRSEWDHRP